MVHAEQRRFVESGGKCLLRFIYNHGSKPPLSINVTGGNAATVAGQWDFDYCDLRATVGNPLAYFDPTFDGPTSTNVNKTQFGTCTSLGVSLINGQEAVVMQVPGDLTRKIGYVMNHGASKFVPEN